MLHAKATKEELARYAEDLTFQWRNSGLEVNLSGNIELADASHVGLTATINLQTQDSGNKISYPLAWKGHVRFFTLARKQDTETLIGAVGDFAIACNDAEALCDAEIDNENIKTFAEVKATYDGAMEGWTVGPYNAERAIQDAGNSPRNPRSGRRR